MECRYSQSASSNSSRLEGYVGIPVPIRIVAMSNGLGQALENSTIHAVRDGTYRRRPTIPLLNSVPLHLTHVVRLNPDPVQRLNLPYTALMCSAYSGSAGEPTW